MLRRTNVPVPADDQRRLDILVPGLNCYDGLPLFCDVTIVSPLTGCGHARSGTSNWGGGLLEKATRDNNRIYQEVVSSGLGKLLCLGAEVYGRWSTDCIEVVPLLTRKYSRRFYPRLRRGALLGF